MKKILYIIAFIIIMTGCSNSNEKTSNTDNEKTITSSVETKNESDNDVTIMSDSQNQETNTEETASDETAKYSQLAFTKVCDSDAEIKVDTYWTAPYEGANFETEYGVISRVVDGKTVWEYKMPECQSAQISSVSSPYVHGDTVYVSGGKFLYAMNKSDGTVLWTTEGVTGVSAMAFDDMNVYASCYLDTDFYVVRNDGEIIHKESNPDYGCIVDSKVDGNTLYLYCEDEMSNENDAPREVAVDISAYKK